MENLALFVPLAKADAAQRLVYGFFDETPDRAGEVFDYASSKPLIQAWSGEIAKASDGKSLGNIRAQHGRNACGKLIDISFDDELKKVGFCAKIVDDAEWAKVEEGVYTGFSPGGKYAKRWADGAHRRYTADVRELSIVDVPCNPAATFTLVKADGEEAAVRFAMPRAYEPGNAATLARAELLAKAAGKPGLAKDYVVRARAELIGEAARAELRKIADEGGEEGGEGDADKAAAPVDKLAAALKDAAAALEEAATTVAGAGAPEGDPKAKPEAPEAGDKKPAPEDDADKPEDQEAKPGEDKAPPAGKKPGEEKPEDADAAEDEDLAAENARLTKAVDDGLRGLGRLTAAVERLTMEKADLARELKRLRDAPLPAKGAVFAVSKAEDMGLAKADALEPELPMEIRALQLRLRP